MCKVALLFYYIRECQNYLSAYHRKLEVNRGDFCLTSKPLNTISCAEGTSLSLIVLWVFYIAFFIWGKSIFSHGWNVTLTSYRTSTVSGLLGVTGAPRSVLSKEKEPGRGKHLTPGHGWSRAPRNTEPEASMGWHGCAYIAYAFPQLRQQVQ